MDEEAGWTFPAARDENPDPAEHLAEPDDGYREFHQELTDLINHHSLENDSDTPDFLLAEYLVDCLKSFCSINRKREQWYGVHLEPGIGITIVRPA